MVRAQLSKLKYTASQPDPGDWPYRSIGKPDTIVSPEEIDSLRKLLPSLRLPAVSESEANVRDGVWHELHFACGHIATISWNDELPDELGELKPIITMFENWAKKENLA